MSASHAATETASHLQLFGAGGFGAILGWYLYYINRYRKGDVQIADIVTLVGAIGGSAVLALFNASTDLFGAYGVGLFVGFFAYFLLLLIFVVISWKTTGNFNLEWFLDGRRKIAAEGWGYGAPQQAMAVRDQQEGPVPR